MQQELQLQIDSPRPRLLVVEDDPDMAAYLVAIARSLLPDVVVDRAARVAEARALLDARSYDLVLADYQLEGRETGLALRPLCEARSPRMRFALTSAYAVHDLPDALGSESFPFLTKPFTEDECRRFLDRLLSVP